jgi:hypothetical protein
MGVSSRQKPKVKRRSDGHIMCTVALSLPSTTVALSVLIICELVLPYQDSLTYVKLLSIDCVSSGGLQIFVRAEGKRQRPRGDPTGALYVQRRQASRVRGRR